jgi:hypothetical protein
VAFLSGAYNLVPNDANEGIFDVFVRDLQAQTTELMSVSSQGVQGDDYSAGPFISLDGRIAGFTSIATNLVPGDTNGKWDVFVHDRQTGATERTSVDSAGVQGDGNSDYGSLSADGRLVAFHSLSTNLFPGDSNAAADMFVHDRQTGVTEHVSVDSNCVPANNESWRGMISQDGRSVTFDSSADNLVPEVDNCCYDVFVHGSYLTLEADPETVPPGGVIQLGTWVGQPDGQGLLVAVDVNGIALFIPVLRVRFDQKGRWSFSGAVQPEISGNAITFEMLGIVPTGYVGISNRERVTFQ